MEKWGRGYGGGGRGRLYTYRYTVTTRMIPALRWAAVMRAILMFHYCEGQSHKTVSTTTTFEEKGEPKRTRTEVPLLTSLMLYRKAKLAHAQVCLHLMLIRCRPMQFQQASPDPETPDPLHTDRQSDVVVPLAHPCRSRVVPQAHPCRSCQVRHQPYRYQSAGCQRTDVRDTYRCQAWGHSYQTASWLQRHYPHSITYSIVQINTFPTYTQPPPLFLSTQQRGNLVFYTQTDCSYIRATFSKTVYTINAVRYNASYTLFQDTSLWYVHTSIGLFCICSGKVKHPRNIACFSKSIQSLQSFQFCFWH